MMECLAGGHQPLCRKKYRSQDNLGSARLNNTVIPLLAVLTSALSHSEGSIHNVHGVLNAMLVCLDDKGGGGLHSEGGKLARHPEWLLHHMTGEVSQLVFDLEGWQEEYLQLTHTAIAARSISSR